MTDLANSLLAAFTEHQDALKRFFRRRFKNAAVAEDLAQETWIRAAGADGSNVIENPRAYLFRIASNLAIDHQRHASRRIELEATENVYHFVQDPAPTPEAIAVGRNEYGHIVKVIEGLPPRCRQVFLLSRFEELSYTEIATRLGISRSTVLADMAGAMTALEAEIRRQKNTHGRHTVRQRRSS